MSEYDEIDEVTLTRIDELLAGPSLPSLPRKRGRPRTGDRKAQGYAEEVWELRRRGLRISRAVAKVATRHGITPIHVYACIKKVLDSDYYDLMEPDPTEPWE
jgi:hypothetical protein